ncbi:MAG: HD-GYP domain-containing protein [Actinomycetota bacterium]|nr:HD-GYP domain-containing protein [Actinomycetota bacterium]
MAESAGIDLPRVGAVSVSFTIIFAAVLLFEPLTVILISLFMTVVWRDIKKKTSIFRWMVNGGIAVFDAGLAALIYQKLNHPSFITKGGLTYLDFPSILLPLALAAITYFLVNTALVSVAIGLIEKMHPLNIWVLNERWTIPSKIFLATLGIALAQLYVSSGISSIILVVAPLLIARESFRVYMRLKAAYGDTVRALIASIEAKDSYTKGHSERVADYVELAARKMRFPENEMDLIKYAALLHDLGKIGIPRRILCKPSQLSSDEYESIKKHSEIGAELLKDVDFLRSVLPVVESHHEYYNGMGYGAGIRGESIPMLARVVSVADAFDAMTSLRSYREPMTFPEAAAELLYCSGSQFDKDVVKIFIEMLGEEGKLDVGSISFKIETDEDKWNRFQYEDKKEREEVEERKVEETQEKKDDLETNFEVKEDLLIIDDWELE